MTDKQRQLIRYIEDHGHRANTFVIDNSDLLEVHSLDQDGQEHSELIPALWTRVREWLGY